ncbi:MAG: hypothetical protein QM762_13165 [Chryseolinea sp.]
MKELQTKFSNDYEIESYESWFYNQATGLLTFSTGENELNFRYLDIGSYSEKSNTWKWSWDNEHTLDNVKEGVDVIRKFGSDHGHTKLTIGYFKSSEVEAWEFVAIGARLCNGIGVYRPENNDGLKMFFVVTEHIDNETAEDIKDKYVKCSEHEYRRRAFVCHHLNKVDKVGFEESFETTEDMDLGDDDDFMAWCSECEAVRLQEDGWNATSLRFADMRLYCEKCYFEMKEVNLGYR